MAREAFIISGWTTIAADRDLTRKGALNIDATPQPGRSSNRADRARLRHHFFWKCCLSRLGPIFFVLSGVLLSHAAGQEPQSSSANLMAQYEGKIVKSVELPGVLPEDRERLIRLLPQQAGQPFSRENIRESIRTLFASGRFADIQAEATRSGDAVVLSFITSPNFFIGAVNVDGAPKHPTPNQIVNAAKFQLGDRYTIDQLDRALENIRQLLQENGYYRFHVTADTTSDFATQQVNIEFHVRAGEQAHVGSLNITGSSRLSSAEVAEIADMHPGDRVTAARVSNSLQKLRKRFRKQSRVLAQISIAEQKYNPATNGVDYTFQIDPGPRVLIYAQGFRISHTVIKRDVPVYEENAVDDDLLNEGERNLLDYLQTRGHFDAKISFSRQSDPDTLRVIYNIDPGPLHRLVLVDITGDRRFLDVASLKSRMQVQTATRFLTHGKFSDDLLRQDVANLESIYRSNGYREVRISTKVDDNYEGVQNHLAVFVNIDEGPQTLVGTLRIEGNEKIRTSDFPQLNTREGQPYSEQNLATDREEILNYYFNNGFPNANLEITTAPSSQPNREDISFAIHEGDRFTVNRVMIGGLDHTREYIVQREIQVHPEDPLSQQDLLNTQTKLYDLGIFSQVDTGVQNPQGTDPEKNVLVQVREANRYTFTYDAGLEFQTGLPAGTSAPQGETGVSPRVGLDITRLNFLGRDQTVTFQSHVGRLQQRGVISYQIPQVFGNENFRWIFSTLYDNSSSVATFTSRRLEGQIQLRQQISRPSSITYRFDYRQVKASRFSPDFSANLVPIYSAPATVGGPGLTYVRDKRDNPLESTKGNYFTLDAFASSGYFGSEADFGRILAQNSTYQAFGGKGLAGHQFVFARSTTIGLEQPVSGSRILAPGACGTNSSGQASQENPCSGIAIIPLPELFFAGGGNSLRGFGLNQAGPRDPQSGFPVGGSAMFINNLELRFPPVSLPFLGQGVGFAIFHDMGNVFTAPHDMLTGLLRWHQYSLPTCPVSATNEDCLLGFDNHGYDYTSHTLGVGVRYKTPIGPFRFDFGYNLNPTRYLQNFNPPGSNAIPNLVPQQLRHFNVSFSIGQPF